MRKVQRIDVASIVSPSTAANAAIPASGEQ
jgi:hypothetical protein